MITKKRLRQLRREVEHTLVFCAVNLEPSDTLTERDIENASERLPEHDEDLERIQREIRYCLGLAESLAEILGDDNLSDRVLRELLAELDAEIGSRLTGEPKRRVSPGFRG